MERLEDVRVQEPRQRRDVRLVERLGIGLLPLGRVFGRPRHVQPRVRPFREDRGALLAGQHVVHRGHDVVRPLRPDDPGGHRREETHPFESRNAAMNPTRASTPSSGIAL